MLINYLFFFFSNLIYIVVIKNDKFFFIKLIHPFFYLLFELFFLLFEYFKNKKYAYILNKELPKLVFYLKSYLSSGIELSQALQKISNNHNWNPYLKNILFLINYYYNKGNSLTCSIDKTLVSISNKKHENNLILLLGIIKVCSIQKGNINYILENFRIRLLEKISAKKKFQTYTAQIRLQAAIISLSPFILAFVLFFISPNYITFFIINTIGNLLFFFMIVFYFLGIYFINKIAGVIK
nr:hypothetical protein GTC16762_14950 [Pigmentibacter ruber]